MDWKVALSAFVMIFLAEVGDKTQLAVLSFVTKTRSPWAVFLGAGGGLLVATVLAVFFGNIVAGLLPGNLLRYLSGGLFVLFGVLVLWGI